MHPTKYTKKCTAAAYLNKSRRAYKERSYVNVIDTDDRMLPGADDNRSANRIQPSYHHCGLPAFGRPQHCPARNKNVRRHEQLLVPCSSVFRTYRPAHAARRSARIARQIRQRVVRQLQGRDRHRHHRRIPADGLDRRPGCRLGCIPRRLPHPHDEEGGLLPGVLGCGHVLGFAARPDYAAERADDPVLHGGRQHLYSRPVYGGRYPGYPYSSHAVHHCTPHREKARISVLRQVHMAGKRTGYP